MGSLHNEKMKKNAAILQQKVFSYDLFKLVKHGIEVFDPNIHPQYYLETMVRFMDLMLMMLEEYSTTKGGILTIQTQRKRR